MAKLYMQTYIHTHICYASVFQVKIGLKLTRSLLSSYETALQGAVENNSDISGSKNQLSNMEIVDALNLVFPNGSKQVMYLFEFQYRISKGRFGRNVISCL